ncbi:Cof-type HAD-IIB family hydrolase [Butyrivibrio sp. WCD2001]|uniref:Cof-type HAD-IIB family hydrolase n=1 Tax=Butyrivibrio sp. WCD2001 TaxID=1280681 RepID=UPI0004299358|nr:Cof-type HAD-IIB family hydrolase [Butyrivibrio sp. WCD2001]
MSKIFFTDLDGTLLTKEKKVSPATMEALIQFTNAGNHFAINTGRAWESAMSVQRENNLFFPGSFLIAYNGSQIYDCDNKKDVYRTGIPFDMIPDIFALSKEYGVHCHTYTDENIVTPAEDEELKYYRRVIHTPYIVSEDINSALTDIPCKIIGIELHDREKIDRFKAAVEELAGDKLTLLYSNPYYLEIFNSEAGKGSAVTRLADYLGIPHENTLAAGDEENDISMIEAAGLGIGMINGTEDVKKAADIITETDNNNDGLAKILLANI